MNEKDEDYYFNENGKVYIKLKFLDKRNSILGDDTDKARILRILDEYIAFWSDETNRNINYEVTPMEVLQSLKEKLMYDKTDKLMENIDFEIIDGKIRIKKED